MEYNPDFVKFFQENMEELLLTPEYLEKLPLMQRQFKEIVSVNSGRGVTLKAAYSFVKKHQYEGVDIGNERLEDRIGEVDYSQADFDKLQELYNEGELRDFSSIPRVAGENNGYTYEVLRLDDPLALTIGTLTDCCQEIHGAGQTSMEHSAVSPDGRVFVVRDEQGRIVAQSWIWRNQYTLCFDNIEIPDRTFKLYEKEHQGKGRKGLTTEVLEVYKKAAQGLMQEDERVYKELLENGTITQEQYDALLLGKVTIGLGYNDIADALESDQTIHKDIDSVSVKNTDRFSHVYTDAGTQYTIAERDEIIKSDYENIYVHQDDIKVYDSTNMEEAILYMMERMEASRGGEQLAYLSNREEEKKLPDSQKIIKRLARRYQFNENYTKVMATARIALIYSEEGDVISIGDIFKSPIKKELTPEQQEKAEQHLKYQFTKAIRQLRNQGKKIDISELDNEQIKILNPILEEIEKEISEKGEKSDE